MENVEKKPSYLDRCKKWINEEFNLTAESVEAVIEQFGRQLQGVGNDNQELQIDLKNTIELLNTTLKGLTQQEGEGVIESSEKNQPGNEKPIPVVNADTFDFDPSSLVPDTPAEPIVLTKEERAERLANLLEHSAITLGVNSSCNKSEGEGRSYG
tara:strand:+ start:69332 stop:69796 length:465 start_codon:yes stop_codon:yes gene_type:complete